MLRQKDIPEAPLAELLDHLVLAEAGAGVEILALGGVEDSFVFEVFEVILEVLCPVGVEKPDLGKPQYFFDVVHGQSLVSDFEFMRFAIGRTRFVDVHLNNRLFTIFSSLTF